MRRTLRFSDGLFRLPCRIPRRVCRQGDARVPYCNEKPCNLRNRVRGRATHPTKRQRPSENCKRHFGLAESVFLTSLELRFQTAFVPSSVCRGGSGFTADFSSFRRPIATMPALPPVFTRKPIWTTSAPSATICRSLAQTSTPIPPPCLSGGWNWATACRCGRLPCCAAM
ncbi:hypothetical protein [Kingella potus]|uniref:hypothetical protein n=1 Tax=Kingella potus TaxID=265175 RepID=UPI001FD31A0A|nr:hypothetical protein [Kingella potus]UOP00906.1 hypothetical protein LVJ84_00290 [Kingella potus]